MTMVEEKLTTEYLPAETASPAELERHRAMIAASPLITEMLDGMLSFALVLNRCRQAVYANRPFRDFLASRGVADITGLRPGALSGCRHAGETAGGCGTTAACRRCGSARVLALALAGKAGELECRIMTCRLGEDLDLKVSAKPFRYNGEDFLLMSLLDTGPEKRRAVMERLFFHDILNTAGGVQGLLNLMESSGDQERKTYLPTAVRASDRMVDQILSHKDLAAAERGEFQPKSEEIDCREFLNELTAPFAAHDAARDRKIAVAVSCEDVRITTDKTLLARVIGNMVKNAVEAEPAGSTITLGCKKTAGGAAFTVHNPASMPEDVRLQVFQRSFSTKGPGRGLGTYSIRLLTEKYLKGKVSFTTGPEGTTFRAELPAAASSGE